LLLPDTSNPFFAEYARHIEDVAFEYGYILLLGNSMESDSRELKYIRTFLDRQVDGILLITAGRGRDAIRELTSRGTPTVVIDNPLIGAPMSSVLPDNESGAYQATHHLIQHGHRRIACIAGPAGLPFSARREAGWGRAMTEAGFPDKRAAGLPRGFSREVGYRAASKLLKAKRPPTAIFASTDHLGIGALRAAATLGARVPQDVAIIAFDGIAESAYTIPTLSTVQMPMLAMARRAICLLLERIADPALAPTHDTFPVQLLPRGSCGCPDLDQGVEPG
jgi:LacI family transcriptional regulator